MVMIRTTGMIAAVAKLREASLLSEHETVYVSRLCDPSFPLAPAMSEGEWLHLHVRVEDAQVTARALRPLGWTIELDRPGFVVLGSDGVTVSVSSVRVAANEGAARAVPCLDHVGVHVHDAAALRRVEELAASQGWGIARQGGDGRPVSCCYATAEVKTWVFPPIAQGLDIAIEFALGEIDEATAEMGEDLRPARPTAGPAPGNACCGGASTSVGIRVRRGR